MEDKKENKIFSYSYSAKQQEEINKIRQKYMPREEDKMEQLKRLDERVAQKGTVAAMVIGIIGALILGAGMSLCLVWEAFIPGIAMGVAGIVGVAAAYPVYVNITKKEREKIAPEIIRLTDELLGE